MSTLHTVNKSPFATQSLISCLGHTQPGDAVLLIEDGIYGALDGTGMSEIVAEMGASVKLFALEEDLAARGIDTGRLMAQVTCVDYGGFVDLVAEHDRTQNWL